MAPVRILAAPEAGDELPLDDGRQDRQRPQGRSLYHASRRGDIQPMAALIDDGADVNAAIDGDGSPLIEAARAGHLPAVELLLDRGADPNLAVVGDGNALIMAAREGHHDIVALLVDRGALIDQVVPSDETALIQASASGHAEVLTLLIARGADVNLRVWSDRSGPQAAGEWRTALSMAQRGRHEAVVRLLVAAGAVQYPGNGHGEPRAASRLRCGRADGHPASPWWRRLRLPRSSPGARPDRPYPDPARAPPPLVRPAGTERRYSLRPK